MSTQSQSQKSTNINISGVVSAHILNIGDGDITFEDEVRFIQNHYGVLEDGDKVDTDDPRIMLVKLLHERWIQVFLDNDQFSININNSKHTLVEQLAETIQSENQVLLLGAGGSGKTILLLRLAQILISNGNFEQANVPFPLFLNLSFWHHDNPEIDFVDWILSTLPEQYGLANISEEFSKVFRNDYIDDGEIILLLDGLDEVAPQHRAACLASILNMHEKQQDRRYRPQIKVVLSCRTRIYEGTHLREHEGFPIDPAIVATVNDRYTRMDMTLVSVETVMKTLTPDTHPGLYTYLEKHATNENKPVEETTLISYWARRPFILHALSKTFRDYQDEVDLGEVLRDYPPEDLMTIYVDTQLRSVDRGFNKDRGFSFLHALVTKHGGYEPGGSFYYIENLQPEFLKNYQWLYYLLSRTIIVFICFFAVGMVMAGPFDYLMSGIAVGLPLGLVDYQLRKNNSIGQEEGRSSNKKKRRSPWVRAVLRFSFIYIILGLIPLLIFQVTQKTVEGDTIGFVNASAATQAFLLTLFTGVVFADRERREENTFDIRPVEFRQLELRRVWRSSLVGGLIGTVLIGSFAAVLSINQATSSARWLSDQAELFNIGGGSIFSGGVIGIFVGLFYGAIIGAMIGVLRTQRDHQMRFKRARPNEGIRQAWRKALRDAIVVTVLLAIGLAGFWTVWNQDPESILRSVRSSFLIGFVVFLANGGIDFINHLILRLMMRITHQDPGTLRLDLFFAWLDDANIVRNVGGGFIFAHKFLETHFANPINDVEDVKPSPSKTLLKGFAVLALVILIASILSLIPIVVQSALYINSPTALIIDETTVTTSETADGAYCVVEGEDYIIYSRGNVREGPYGGYVSTEGKIIGVLGMSMGTTYNISEEAVHGSLMCRIGDGTDADWQQCSPELPFYYMVFPLVLEVREYPFTAWDTGCIQFEINDIEPEKRIGAFSVDISAASEIEQ